MNRPGKPSNLADGRPIEGEFIAVVDETIPTMGGGVIYVLTTAVMFEPATMQTALSTLFDDTPNRVRAFHWHKEGPVARQKILDIIINGGVVAHSRYQPAARTKQVACPSTAPRASR